MTRSAPRRARTSSWPAASGSAYDKLLLATGSSRAAECPAPTSPASTTCAGSATPTRCARCSPRGRGRWSSSAPAGSGWRSPRRPGTTAPRSPSSSRSPPRCTQSSAREVGDVFAALHRDHGVDVRTSGTGVEGIEGGDGRVTRRDARRRATVAAADAVVVGVGVKPNVRAGRGGRARGRRRRRRRRAAAHLRPGHLRRRRRRQRAGTRCSTQRVRVEHWANARTRARRPVAAMAGKGEPYAEAALLLHRPVRPGHGVPRHVGAPGLRRPGRAPRRRRRRGSAWPSGCADGRVLAGMNVNVWDVTDAIKALARRPHGRRPGPPRRPRRTPDRPLTPGRIPFGVDPRPDQSTDSAPAEALPSCSGASEAQAISDFAARCGPGRTRLPRRP